MTEAPHDPNDPSQWPSPGEGTGWPQTPALDAAAILGGVRADVRKLEAERRELIEALDALLAADDALSWSGNMAELTARQRRYSATKDRARSLLQRVATSPRQVEPGDADALAECARRG